MLRAPELTGCYPALITPMSRQGDTLEVDTDAFHRLIADVIDAGVAGIVIAGTTGQSATLSHDEHVELVREGALYARAYARGKGRPVKVIASAGSNSTAEARDMSRRILAAGNVDALLHVTGYYNNPPQEGLLKHFRLMGDLAAENDAAVILYNVPGRTNSNITAETCVELAKHPAIIAVKEASGKIEQVQAILDGTDRDEFSVVSGEDHLVAEIIRRGGTGVISAAANVWPSEFQTLCDLALAGKHAEAAELQEALMPCVAATFSVKNPIPLHHMLGSDLRLPLVSVGDLREPGRSAALAKINAALAIRSFPHCGAHVGPQTVGAR